MEAPPPSGRPDAGAAPLPKKRKSPKDRARDAVVGGSESIRAVASPRRPAIETVAV